ncbi:hypothetical protein ACQBAT_12900 [Ornithinimicrobium sp. Y1847]|uniref:hypothetical protein n=1 Tax=Ornithinimicrobium sp. Y1847 TaxID=3405419 RepID=UPI003B67EE8E
MLGHVVLRGEQVAVGEDAVEVGGGGRGRADQADLLPRDAALTEAPQDEASVTGRPDQASVTQTVEVVSDTPPFQNPDALPPVTWGPDNPDLPNAWQIPDARPTGIAFLDVFGSPQSASQYPRTMPLMSFMVANHGYTGMIEALAGANFSYYDGTNTLEQETVEINITAWDDSAAILDSFRTGEFVTDARWTDANPPLRDWPGRADTDHLLVASAAPWGGIEMAGAMVRQGDYLVGVTVQATTEERAIEAATQIAEQTAANLAYLDPEHGTE